MKELIQIALSGFGLLLAAWMGARIVLGGMSLDGAAALLVAMIVLPIATAAGVLLLVRQLWRERQTAPPTPANVYDFAPAPQMLDYYKPPQLPPATYRVSVPLNYVNGKPRPAGVVLTSRAETATGQAIELGASMETLRKLAPLVGHKPPTRANAKDVGIVSNAELSSLLDWLAAHGWVSPGEKGRAREWIEGATSDAFTEWLDQFEGAPARAR